MAEELVEEEFDEDGQTVHDGQHDHEDGECADGPHAEDGDDGRAVARETEGEERPQVVLVDQHHRLEDGPGLPELLVFFRRHHVVAVVVGVGHRHGCVVDGVERGLCCSHFGNLGCSSCCCYCCCCCCCCCCCYRGGWFV